MKRSSIPKGGHFPEFDSMVKAIEKIYHHSSSMNQAHTKAFSPDFKKFAESQPPEISAGFLDINEVALRELELMKEINTSITEYPATFGDLRELHVELELKQSQLNSKIAAEKKAKSAAEKADDKVQAAQKKNSPDVSKFENEARDAHAAADQAQREAEEEQRQYNTYFESYKKRFIDSLSVDLTNLATKRSEPLDQLAKIADDYGAAALKLRKYEDTQIAQFQSALEELETITIE